VGRVLVTGAGGFLGRHVVNRLSQGHEVYAMTRAPVLGDTRGVHWLRGDLEDPSLVDRLPTRIDAVAHLAQARPYRDFPERAREIWEVNVQSSLRLLDYARRANASVFMQASTGGLYGLGREPFVETDDVHPKKFIDADPAGDLNFYFTSKYAAELLLANYARFFRTVVFRFFFIYGPGQTGMLIPNLLGRVAADEEVTVQGDPGMRLNPVNVDDAVRVFEPALGQSVSGPVNVAGDEVVTITELVRLMGEVTGRRPRIRHTEAQPAGDIVADTTRMRDALGVTPTTSLREGLAAMVPALR
jgi:UDP-glucose 4-epimerase